MKNHQSSASAIRHWSLGVVLAASLLRFGSPPASAQTVPLATTLPASGLLNDVATLNGIVDPQGAAATAWFEWGSGLGYANTTPPMTVGGILPVSLSAGLTDLTAGMTYHYRMVASNSVGVARGVTQVFWSPAMVLNGPDPLTTECHATFVDPGVKMSASPVALAVGGDHGLALRGDGTIVGWGYNDEGQTNIPAAATNVVALAPGLTYHSLALRGDGTAVGWGRNHFGEATIPANVTNVVALAAGYVHNLALRGDGAVVAWGKDDDGETTIPAAATNVVALAAGYSFSLALRGNGTVVGWGRDSEGQATIPGSAANVVAIAAGYSYGLALRGNGTVVGWGWNYSARGRFPPARPTWWRLRRAVITAWRSEEMGRSSLGALADRELRGIRITARRRFPPV